MMRSCGCSSAVYTCRAAPHRERERFTRQRCETHLEVGGRARQRLHIDAPLGGVQAEGLERALLAQAASEEAACEEVAPATAGRERVRASARAAATHRSAMSMNSLPP